MGVQRSTARAFRRSRDRSRHGGGGAGIRPLRTPQRSLREKAVRSGVLRSTTRESRPVDGRPGHRMRSVSLGTSHRTEGEFCVIRVNCVGVGAIRSWFEALFLLGNGFRAKNGGVEGRVRRARSQAGGVRFLSPTGDDEASCEANAADAVHEIARNRGEFCVIRVNYVVIGALESRYAAVLSCGSGLKTKNTVVERRSRRPEDGSRGVREVHRSWFGLRRSGAEREGVRSRAVSACAANSYSPEARASDLGQRPSLALRASVRRRRPARRTTPGCPLAPPGRGGGRRRRRRRGRWLRARGSGRRVGRRCSRSSSPVGRRGR